VQINTEGISTQGELAAAIIAANQTGAGAGVVKLLICGDIDLTKALASIDLKPGVSLDIEGSGFTVGGSAAGFIVDSGAMTIEDLNFGGPLSVALGCSLSGDGVIEGAVVNDGRVVAEGGVLTLRGSVSGHGAVVIDKGADAVFGAAVSQTIQFASGGGRLTLDAPRLATGLIENFVPGDTIDLAGVKATSLRRSGSTVAIYDGSRLIASLDIAGTAGREIFSLASDGSGGTTITAAPWTQVEPTPTTTILAAPSPSGPGSAAGLRLLQFAAGHLVRPATGDGLRGPPPERLFHPATLARP
jgi:hypothetical protein